MVISLSASPESPANEPLPDLLPSVKTVRDLTLPLGADGTKPTLKFMCGSARVERKSFGFLTIGVLPQLVLEDVELRITGASDPKIWARDLYQFLSANSVLAGAVMKQLRIRPAVGNDLIHASRAYFDRASGRLVLERPEIELSHGKMLHAGKGYLELDGPNAGQLSLAILGENTILITHERVFFPPD